MKKIIKLTESDLHRIVKNVVKENFSFGTKSETLKEIERNFLKPIDEIASKFVLGIEDLAYSLEDYLQNHKDEIESDEFYENEYNELLEIAKIGQEAYALTNPLTSKISQLYRKRPSAKYAVYKGM